MCCQVTTKQKHKGDSKMKRQLLLFLLITVLGSACFAADFVPAFKINAKSAAYVATIGNTSSTSSMDSMIGIGFALKYPLKKTWSLVIDGQYNTGSGFTNSLGGKTDVQVHPIELNIERSFGGWYLGGGLNYTLWSVKSGSTTFNEQNGLGGQFYGGWSKLFSDNTDLEIKYTYMSASVNISGTVVNQAVGTLSVGTKIWVN